MIFVGSNIPMYLVGTPHPNRDAAFRFLAQSAKIRTAFELFTELVNRVLPIEMADVETAARIVESGRGFDGIAGIERLPG